MLRSRSDVDKSVLPRDLSEICPSQVQIPKKKEIFHR